MIIYNYEKDTKAFTVAEEAEKSPLEEGVYLIPANATEIAPPEIPEGFAAVFNNNSWSLIEDNRGKEYWNVSFEKGKIKNLGENLPVDACYTRPPSDFTDAYEAKNGEWFLNQNKYMKILQENLDAQIQMRLDIFAQTRQYQNMDRLCTYVNSTNPTWSSEGSRGIDLRDQTWQAASVILNDVLAGNRPVPNSIEDIESELPTLSWS